MARTARKTTAKRSKTAKKKHAKGPNGRKRAAKKTTRRRPPHVGEEERIALRRERVLLATAGGASLRQIAAELGVSVGTVHEDVSAELLALRDRTRSTTEDLRDLEVLRLDRALRALHPVMQGDDDALRVQATRVLHPRPRPRGSRRRRRERERGAGPRQARSPSSTAPAPTLPQRWETGRSKCLKGGVVRTLSYGVVRTLSYNVRRHPSWASTAVCSASVPSGQFSNRATTPQCVIINAGG